MITDRTKKRTSDSYELEYELGKSIDGEVRFDSYTKAMYSTDASIYQMDPIGIVLPKTENDVSEVLRIAHKNSVNVLPRGGGTSLSGQTVNHAIVIDFSKYMNRILEINPEERWVTTEPGLTIDDLNRQLKTTNLHFTPDPSTSNRATIGGAMGNNSCGAHSIIYGKTVDHVKEMKIVLSDGTVAKISELTSDQFTSKKDLPGLEGNIYREIVSIASSNKDEIEKRFPKILRRVGGYNLDLIQDQKSLNISNLMVGSEGTLASVCSARLNLEPLPAHKGLAIIHFENIKEAMEATVKILEQDPVAVEHIGEMILNQARNSIGFSRNLGFLQGNPSDILVVEMTGETQKEVGSKLAGLTSSMKKLKFGYNVTSLFKDEDQNKVWEMRKAGLGLMMNIPGSAKPLPFVEDTAVSPERLPEYVQRFDSIVQRHGTTAGYYGHASVGCLHIRPVVNLKDDKGIKVMEAISSEISDLVLEFGGAMSAEHGDGIVRGVWAEKMFGKNLVDAFRDIKNVFDPKSIMNPGKIFDTPPITENLRYGKSYKTTQLKTKLDFGREGGFEGAIENCNGVGACRKVNAGAMCPSYMATRDEEDSTRGRANALRAVISNSLDLSELQSTRMFKVLDLCLECKSCKSECPSNVDMAKIKYEFLFQYFKKHRFPIRSRLIANIHKLNSFTAGPQSKLVNFINHARPTRWILDWMLGIDRRRKIPSVVSQTFESWFHSHIPGKTNNRGNVVLFHDTFMNFNHPQSGISATRLLESLGYKVNIVDRKCCGKPMISHGLLNEAEQNAKHNIESLYPYVETGAKIVGCESSCLYTLKDDYPDLLKQDERALKVSNAAVMLEDLLVSTNGDGKQQIAWTNKIKHVQLFVHCHQRALSSTENAFEALTLPPGYNVSLIESGCCGMAGSFGFEKEHYDISMKIGEDRLFPTIRKIPKNNIIAVTGVSCKQQIEDGTGRKAYFLSEILADALI